LGDPHGCFGIIKPGKLQRATGHETGIPWRRPQLEAMKSDRWSRGHQVEAAVGRGRESLAKIPKQPAAGSNGRRPKTSKDGFTNRPMPSPGICVFQLRFHKVESLIH